MATNYPSGLDAFANPDGSDALGTGHAAQHGNANDAIEAIEGELGLDPAGGSATVKARFDTIEANDWVTTARIADSQVTSAKILDATITGSDIASGTVTSTNLLDGTIVNADVNAAAAIDKTKIAGTAVTVADTGTVTSTMLLDGTIVNADVNAAAAIVKTKISGTAVTLADSGTVTSTMIADATITGTDIATGTVTSANLLDGTIVNADVNASAAIDITKLSGAVASSTIGNLLTANAASGGDTLGTTTGVTCVTATLAYSTAFAAQGAGSIALTITGAGAYAAYSPTAAGLSAVPVVASQSYTATAAVQSTSATVTGTTLRIRWFTVAGTAISDTSSAATTVNSSAFTTITVSGMAPPTAAYACWYFGASGHNGEVFYLDKLGLWSGTGGLWRLPGSPIPNLGTYTDETVGRRIFTWDTVNSRWQMTYGDTGQRTAGSSLGSGWTATYDLISRVGGLVTINMILAKTGSNTVANGETLATLPAGFRPQTTTYNVLGILSGVSGTTVFQLATTGALTYFGATTGTITNPTAYLTLTFRTADAWPASLPGTASGAIPQ